MSSDTTGSATELAPLTEWEQMTLDAVGRVIEFWGFKHNHGRIWAALYVRDAVLTSGELQELLGLSKAALSMLLREIEGWGVIKRVRRADQSSWCYEAETDFMRMAGRVIARREAALVNQVVDELEDADRKMRANPPGRESTERVEKMLSLAKFFQHAVNALANQGQFDFQQASEILDS